MKKSILLFHPDYQDLVKGYFLVYYLTLEILSRLGGRLIGRLSCEIRYWCASGLVSPLGRRAAVLVVGCLHCAAPELEVAVVIHFFLFCPFLVLPAADTHAHEDPRAPALTR